MKLPWDNSELEEKIDRLEKKVEELEEEKQRMENRFEAEKERRSELANKKQEAEKRLKKLGQKLEARQEDEEEQELPTEEKEPERADLTLEEVRSGLDKLESVRSEEEDLLTVYSSEKISDINDLRALKNYASKDTMERLEEYESFVAFTDELFLDVLLEMRPFFESEWVADGSFKTSKVQEFIESDKTWVIVSAGSTRIVKEVNGQVKEIENVKTRVDRKHTQGGFSQGRFERKREEQIQNHLDAVREELEADEPLLVGDRKLCQQLDGEYLGGFDDNRPLIDALYSFRLVS